MQQFEVKLTVTVNTSEIVSSAELLEELEDLLEDFDGGTIAIDEVNEK